jgi:hypothetical protein
MAAFRHSGHRLHDTRYSQTVVLIENLMATVLQVLINAETGHLN